MTSLDAFFQVSEMPTSFSLSDLSQTPKQFDYQQVRKQLFDKILNDDNIDAKEDEVECDPELMDVVKITKQAFERLKAELTLFTTLKRNFDDITNDIDNLYKTRNDIIHGLRGLTSTPEFEERINKLETEIETLTQDIACFKESEKSACLGDINKTKKNLTYLQDAFCIHKWCKTTPICPVCLTNEVNIYLNPCGHTFCDKCMTRDYCDICRCRVMSKGKLYL